MMMMIIIIIIIIIIKFVCDKEQWNIITEYVLHNQIKTH
jgi:hypothetical protein